MMTTVVRPTPGLTGHLPKDPPATPTVSEFVEQSAGLLNRTWMLKADADELHSGAVDHHTELVHRRIEGRGQALTARGADELLDQLAESGMACRAVAAIVGVSVPAVRKWRAGGAATGDNLLRIAELLALLEWLNAEQHIGDVANWLEVPPVAGIPITRMQLLINGRRDLLLASLVGPGMEPADVLDAFDPEWRTTYQSDFEVFTAADGQRSIRSKAR